MGHPIQIDQGCAGGLEIHRGRTGYRFRPVIGKRLVLGSAPECDLRLGGAGMPPVHSQVHVDGGRVWIEAISADPPILINGEPCQMNLLVDGDVIALGPFAFTWRSAEAPVVAASPAENLSMDELVERLEQDMAMVADRDATTRQAVATVVEAALETLYGGKPVPSEVAGGGGLEEKLDELVRRIEAHEAAHAAAVESLMDTQERLVAQVGSLVAQLLDERSGGESLRASA